MGETEKEEFMKNKKTMKELPLWERPYEKAESEGIEQLSDKELLTIFVRSGTKKERADEVAGKILDYCGEEGLQALWNIRPEELKKLPGIGRVKAIQLLCVCELARRIARGKRLYGTRISSPEDIVLYYNIQLKFRQKECLVLIILDSKNRIISDEVLSLGNVHSSIADPREIFLSALKKNGVSVILLHNHPSGDPTPSTDDILITERVEKAGKFLGIPLKDHIILGDNSYISLRAEGHINSE